MDWTEADSAAWDEDGTLPARWEMVASVDHGLRPGDETMALEAAYVAAYVAGPIIATMTGRNIPHCVYCDVVEVVGDWSGDGWCEPTGDDPYCERVCWLHDDVVVYQTWNRGVTGFFVESDADAGMTWFFARTNSEV